MPRLPVYPRCSGDLFEYNGRTLVAIAPCCPVYHRTIQHKSGKQTISTVPAKFWGKVAKLTDFVLEESTYRHLPVFRHYPTWVVVEYYGGNPLDYVRKGWGSELTLWWCKHCPDALNYRPLLLPVENQAPSYQEEAA
jgi:hypothetical protein